MRLRLAQFITVVAVAIGLTGCKSSKAAFQTDAGRVLADADVAARATGLAGEEIAAAKKLYVIKCARCHKFYDPGNYGDTEWDSWMKKMGKKARLKPEQYELLARYMASFRNKDDPKKSAP